MSLLLKFNFIILYLFLLYKTNGKYDNFFGPCIVHNVFMKKLLLVILILLIYVFTIAGILFFNGYVDINNRAFDVETYNVKDLYDSGSKANDILYEYLKKVARQSSSFAEDSKNDPREMFKDGVWAIATDIDNDGIDEIIGAYVLSAHCGIEFCDFLY